MGQTCCSQQQQFKGDIHDGEPFVDQVKSDIDIADAGLKQNLAAEDEVEGSDIVKGILDAAAKNRIEIQKLTDPRNAEGADSDDDIDQFFGLQPNAYDASKGQAPQPPGRTPGSAGATAKQQHIDKSLEKTAQKSDESNPARVPEKANVVPQPGQEDLPAEAAETSAPGEGGCKDSDRGPDPSAVRAMPSTKRAPKKVARKAPAAAKTSPVAKKAASPAAKANGIAGLDPEVAKLLAACDTMLKEIDAAVSDIDAQVLSGTLLPGKARDALAQLETQLNKLQCKDIDGIDLSGINDIEQQTQARAARKELIKCAAQQFGKFDTLFASLKSLDAEGSSSISQPTQMLDVVLQCPSVCMSYAGTYKSDSATLINEMPVWRRQGGKQLIYNKAGSLLIASGSEAATKGHGMIRSLTPVQNDTASWESVKWAILHRETKKWTHERSITANTLKDDDKPGT